MARYTVTIPVNKSSNESVNWYVKQQWDERDGKLVANTISRPSAIADTLTFVREATKNSKRLSGAGLAWDGALMPINKKIVSAKLYMYSLNQYNYVINYRYTDFIEGNSIPSMTPISGSYAGEIVGGWNAIDIGTPQGNSLVLYIDMPYSDYISGSFRFITGAVARFSSHRDEDKRPYVVIVYDDLPPSTPSNLTPRDSEVNIEEPIRFSWKHNSNEGYFQKGFTLQYSTDNQATWTTITKTTSNQYYDLPANTFKSSTPVLWKVKTTDGNDEVSEFGMATFSGRVPPSLPTNLIPKDVGLNPNNVIRFTWKHNSKDAIAQKGFILEYSKDDGGNWATINKTTNDEFYDMPAKTFPKKGTITWRIRTTDINGLTSKESSSQFTLKTPPDDPSSLYPNNITLNPREVIKFSWLHNSNSDLGQKDFTLQYSINLGETWETITQTTSNQYHDLPANTFPISGVVTWQVKTTDGNGDSTSYKSAGFTLGTPPQQVPLPIQPVGAYLDSTEPISFEWHFMGGTPGETQTKFDLQYSLNSGSDWVTITEATSRKSKELPANTFNLTGNITWRIRTYNNYDEVSPYSENKTFYVISSPPIPQILDISNNARPTIKWTSQGQHIYELQIVQEGEVIFKSGSIPSVSDREYKLIEYLKDGNYTVKIRVINEYDLYSTWAEKSFAISTTKPPKPIISIYNGEHTVTINTNITSLKTLVYRENIKIGETIDGNFIDYTGANNKEYKYFLRSINEDDNFHDSDIKLSKCSFKHNTIATLESPDKLIQLKYGLGSQPTKSNMMGTLGGLNYYDGRKNPVSEFAEFKQFDKSLNFVLRTKEEVDNLARLIDENKTLIYRDYDGENIKGTVFSLKYNRIQFGYDVGFTISRTEV